METKVQCLLVWGHMDSLYQGPDIGLIDLSFFIKVSGLDWTNLFHHFPCGAVFLMFSGEGGSPSGQFDKLRPSRP